MSKFCYERIVVKIGTNVLSNDDGLLNEEVMQSIVSQVALLKQKGLEVIIVSSGAVGAGRALLHNAEAPSSVEKRQVLAAVGQVHLMDRYNQYFGKEQLLTAQVLTTKEDFRSRHHYLNMKHCFEALLADNVIPIVNENDVISVEELMFTDNDELAGMITSMMSFDALILLTNVGGVYDKSPSDPNAKLITSIKPNNTDWQDYIQSEKSLFGRGGMLTKCTMAQKLASSGIATHIINGRDENVLVDVLQGKQCGTQFVPGPKVTSPIKRWIAHSEGTEKGSVTINPCAVDILTSDKVVSLLPVGAVSVDGEFEKGDIIKICTEDGTEVGLGMAQYDASFTRSVLGKKGEKPIIHYDYLYVF